MKKNKMMRLASAMLMMTLLTTSVISGTFAKYVTSDTATDTARVAKFGVTVTAGGYLFDETYKAAEDNGPGQNGDVASMTVVSVGQADATKIDNVVAPGTKNSDGLTFTVTGTPEVDVAVSIEVKDAEGNELTDADNIFLKANTYEDMTTGADDQYVLSADYYPVKYTLTQTVKNNADEDVTTTLVDAGNLSAINDKLAELTQSNQLTYDALTDLSTKIGTLKLTWEWAFNGDDKADTILGDIAAGTVTTNENGDALIEGTDYNLNTGLTITVSVTQID